jgi:hypothetical protein
MDDDQLERFGEAVERKQEEAKAASEATGERREHGSKVGGDQASLSDDGRPQDVADPRAKSAGKGKKTADKWNQ